MDVKKITLKLYQNQWHWIKLHFPRCTVYLRPSLQESSPREQIDSHHPGVEMASSHIKQRVSSLFCFCAALLLVLITSIITNTQNQHNLLFFSHLPLSLPPWLFLWHGATVDVGICSIAPTHEASYSLPLQRKTQLEETQSPSRIWHSWPATVKTEPFYSSR